MRQLGRASQLLLAVAVCSLCAVLSSPTYSHPGAEHKLSHLNARIEQQPNSQSAYIQRAALYTRTGKYVLAEQDFATAKNLGDAYLASYELGAYYFKIEDYPSAIRQFDSYLAHYPNHYPSLEYRAKAYEKVGEIEQAFKDFGVFLQQSPYTNPGHYLAVARIALSLPHQKDPLADAINILDDGLSKTGNSPQLQAFAIELELRRGFFSQAIARQESLREMTSASPQWHVEMADILVKSLQQDQALNHLKQGQHKLATYKNTPARQKLLLRIEKMQHAIEAAS